MSSILVSLKLLGLWPFASVWMLVWGLAAVVPLVLHLWNRRKYQQVPWAAMEYLLVALQKNSRRIRVEQYILLIVRTMILLVLALALADPVLSLLRPLQGTLGAGGRTHFVLVVDGSYSMDLRAGDGPQSLFDSAKQLAGQLVRQGVQGDAFTLVLMADPPQVVIGQPAFAQQDVLDELQGLELTHGGANLSATMAEVTALVERTRRAQPRLQATRVYFLTDLGAATWNEVESPSCRRLVTRLGEASELKVLDLGLGEAENLAVTRLQARESLITVAGNTALEAEIQNFGHRAHTTTVRFLVDDREVHQERVEVAAAGRASVVMTHRFETAGEHRVEARLGDDMLAVDNRRWLSVPVRESVRVLCIGGRPESARYVRLALQPSESDRSVVRPESRPESALLEVDLHDYDAIFLCNVARFGRDEVAVLRDYLKHGGGLVICLGDAVQSENYNLELTGEEGRGRLLPARLGATIAEARYGFDPLEYRHPIVQPFRDHEQTGLLTTPVWKYVRLTPIDKTKARVAVAFDNGDPAIIEERLYRGRTILFATAVSPASKSRDQTPPTPWTALSSWPSFVPLIQETLALAASRRDELRNVSVGDSLQATVYGRVTETPLTVEWPRWMQPGSAPRRERVRMRVVGEDSQWTVGPTATSGFYRADYGPPVGRSEWYAVNVKNRESRLERFDEGQLPSQFKREESSGDTDAPALPDQRPHRYFRLLLGTVLALLLVETLVAWYFGNASG